MDEQKPTLAEADAEGTPEFDPERNPLLSNQPAFKKERAFHGWRLIGYVMIVIVVLAVASAIVDWIVIGPLEGRAPWL